MKKILLALVAAVVIATPAIARENYVEKGGLSHAESLTIYLAYFPKSVGM